MRVNNEITRARGIKQLNFVLPGERVLFAPPPTAHPWGATTVLWHILMNDYLRF